MDCNEDNVLFQRLNKYQTPLNQELKDEVPKEVWNDMVEYIDSVKMIKWLISNEETRGYAKDRPRDKDGKIVVDIVHPHILEDMDFFRGPALAYKEHGRYTEIRPNPNPRSDYANFWRQEQHRWDVGLVRPSDGEWIPGWYYFYLNYSPIWINEKVSDSGDSSKSKGKRFRSFPKAWLGDYLFFHYMEMARSNGHHCKLLKTRGVGFATPNSEGLASKQGIIKTGDVKVGDNLISREGVSTKVLEVYPQGEKDIYEVVFHDGRKSRCTKDHLWSVYDKNKGAKNKDKLYTYKTSHLIEKGLSWSNKNGNTLYKYYIPDIEPIQYDKKDLAVDPYVLGCLLGDGSMSNSSIRIATVDSFIVEEIQRRLGDKYEMVRDYSTINYRLVYSDARKYKINPLKNCIRALKLDVSTSYKFIPEEYLLSSVSQRIELLQGLMDTDGSISKDGYMEFSNSNLKLIKDVARLCRSLGIGCLLSKGRASHVKNIKGKDCNIKQEYRLHIRTNKVIFKLPRKVERFRVRDVYKYNAIIAINKLNYKEESTCFLVDNEEHLYLMENFIPTHNSYKTAAISPRNMYVERGLPNFHLASDKGFLEGDKGVFGKVVDTLDWIAESTPLPKLRLIDRGLEKQLGYTDEYGVRKGFKSSVFGISLKDNPDKARGIRGPLIHYEEDGLFPDLETA